ncbi:MAG: hypothetical protein ACC661_05615, partial [Verrucomicrobiales bacterium]
CFGVGVLGMALSTIIILMLISGFTFCEMFDLPPTGMPHRIGSLIAGLGVLGPFIWKGKTLLWLAIPTSVIGGALLPIAYITFLFMMNSKKILGDDRPAGVRRVRWNVLMGLAAGTASAGVIWKLNGEHKVLFGSVEVRDLAFWAMAAFVIAAVATGWKRYRSIES